MMNFKRSMIPNAITLSNAIVGMLILMIEDPFVRILLFSLALIMDLLDGYAARRLEASSAVGKELDSLADMLSFGAVPAYILYQIFEPTLGEWALLSSGYAAAAAFRLAKFNVQPSAAHFYGLPTPAAAIMVFTMYYLSVQGNTLFFPSSIIFSLTLIFLIYFVVTSTPLPSLKSGKSDARFIFLLIAVMLVMGYLFEEWLWSLAIPMYVMIGSFWFKRRHGSP